MSCWRCDNKGWYPVARLTVNRDTPKWVTGRKACRCCAMKPDDYTEAFVIANPIPARCTKCQRLWIDGNGNGAIRAPGLSNCACFYCHGKLIEIEMVQAVRKDDPAQMFLF